MNIISKRLSLIKPSPTLAVTQKALELKARGKNIISLGAGEPDFDTPENIKNAAIEGINKGLTKYTNVDGMPKLKEAIRDKFKRENDLEYDLSQIIVSTGGKQVIYNLFMASLDDGDEVIIPAPYWVSYPDMVLLSGGVPVFVPCTMEDGFKLTAKKLEKAISAKTKYVIINSPSNPCGAAYSESELREIASVLQRYENILIMSDDIYEHITFDNFKFKTFAQVAQDLKHRTFIVNGVSKSYSMTGWRIGYGAGDKRLIKAMGILQSQSTSNASSISQVAAIEALAGNQSFIKPNAKGFEKKRDLALSILNSIDKLECYKPEGAFYLFPKCDKVFGLKAKKVAASRDASTDQDKDFVIQDSNDLATYLLEEANVAVVPGIAFGLDGYFRISYAMSTTDLEEACNRIKIAISKLSH